MRISFPYPNIPPVNVPDANLLGYYGPQRVRRPPNVETLLSRALANPIAAPRLSEAVRPDHRVLILVDDLTRPTPQAVLLPSVLAELRRGGVHDENVRFLFAYGSHRRMTAQEKEERLGSEIFSHYETLDHDWEDQDHLSDLGKLEDGTPVIVNRHLVESDFVLSVGHIVPHRSQGFTGGAKMVLPGVAGKASLDHMHWQDAQYPGDQILGHADNPLRRMSNAFGVRAGLNYILNVVLDDRRRVLGAWAGDPAMAHRAGCVKSIEVYGVTIPQQADICITDSYPADIDLWQANKAIFAMEPAVKEGGVVILVTPVPEGVSRTHPILIKVGYRPHQQIEQMVREGKLEPGAGAAALSDVGRIVREKATCIMVSPGIKSDVQRELGLHPASTPQDALEQAFALKGRDATVLVFHHGGEILPVVKGA